MLVPKIPRLADRVLTSTRLPSTRVPTDRAAGSATYTGCLSTDGSTAIPKTVALDVRSVSSVKPCRSILELWCAISGKLPEHIHSAWASYRASVSDNTTTARLSSCSWRTAAIHASQWCEWASSHRSSEQWNASFVLRMIGRTA